VLADYGWQNRILRWKVTLHVKIPAGSTDPVKDGRGLRFQVTSKMENERITRQCFVTVDNAQVIYAPGRSIRISVQNPEDLPVEGLEAHWQVDEFAAGLSTWEDVSTFPGLVAEVPLIIPNFCDTFEVFSPGSAAPPARIRGYGPGGVLYYDEVVSTPRSGSVDVVPRLDYTITPTAGGGAGPQDNVVVFNCEG